MNSRPVTPAQEIDDPVVRSRPQSLHSRPNSSYIASGASGGGDPAFERGRAPQTESSPLTQSLDKQDDVYASGYQDAGSIQESHAGLTGGDLRRSSSQISQSLPARGGTLKKKPSLRKTGSMKRSSSRRSSRAGSVRSLALGEKEKYGDHDEYNSAFSTPVPTVGSPTDILANRFQGESLSYCSLC